MIDIPDSVFEQDKDGNALCPRCHRVIQKCVCPSLEDSLRHDICLRVSVHKTAKGKWMTHIDGFPPHPGPLKKWLKQLKSQIGTGGTFAVKEQNASIYLQGRQTQKAVQWLRKNHFQIADDPKNA
jgi:translation initiation factor 1 (eIF-1/SUI1)